MAARGIAISPGEASSLSVAVAMQAMGLEGLQDQEHEPATLEGRNGSSASDGGGVVVGESSEAGEESGAARASSSCEGGEAVRVVVVTEEENSSRSGGAELESEQDHEQRMETRVDDEEEVKVKPAPGTLYADLGDFEPVNLLSFAYQIASGMVSDHEDSRHY